MTQDTSASGHMAKQTDGTKNKDNKRDRNFQTKVVIRRLPPSMTEPQFIEQVSPIPSNDYFHFVKSDLSLGIHAFTRAYLNFLNQEDVFMFKDKFDGYVFIDAKGNEYPAIVEFAPFQKIPKRRSKKRDAKCGTLAQDPEYLKFLASLENPEEVDDTGGAAPSAETYLEEIEARERDLKENGGTPKQTTPLIEYLKQRKLERQRVRDEKREERKKRELEKKKARDEERRKKKLTPVNASGHDKYDSADSHTSNRSGHNYYSSSKDSKDNKKDTDSAGVKLTLLKNSERPERDDTRSTAGSSRGSLSSHHGSSYHDSFSNRDRKDRDKDKRNRDDGERFDRFRGNRERYDRKDRDSDKYEKNKDSRDKDRTESERTYEKEKYNKGERDKEERSEKGYLSRRERERQREKVAAARERERAKLQKEKDDKKSSKSTDTQKVKGFASKKETFLAPIAASLDIVGIIPDDPAIVAAAIEKPKSASSSAISFTAPNNNNEGGSSSSCESKDPRVERRIRNKDRPSLEIYRPGMRRLSSTNPSQGGSGGSAKNYQSENNSQNNSGENSPRSYSPSNNEQVYDDEEIIDDPVDEQINEIIDNLEEDIPRLSEDDNND